MWKKFETMKQVNYTDLDKFVNSHKQTRKNVVGFNVEKQFMMI